MIQFPLTAAEAELVLRALLDYQRYHNGHARCAAADLAERLEQQMTGPVEKVAGTVTEGSGA